MFLLQTILFGLVLFFVFYLPGKFFLRVFKYQFENVLNIPISLTIGVCFFIFLSYLLRIFNLDFLFNLILIPIVLWEVKSFLKARFPDLKKALNIELLLVLTGTIVMTFITFYSGSAVDKGIVFYGNNARDGLYHLGLVTNLINFFPPTHPELSNVPLRGYHFFYDFLLAQFNRLYRFNTIDLTFRFFSFFIAFLYGTCALALGIALRMKKFSLRIFLFLIYFAGGVELILAHLWGAGRVFDTGLNPLLVNILNPSLPLSISILFVVFILLFKSNNKSLFLPALLIGILPEIKIYTAIVLYMALLFVSLVELFKNKQYFYLKILLVSSVISAIVFLPFNLGEGGLVFAPLTLYSHFISTFSTGWQIRINNPQEPFIKKTILFIIAILFYYLPTLGLRLAVLMGVKQALSKKFYSSPNLFLLIITAFGFLAVTLFLQSEDIFNIIQFLWISYILLLIPTAISIGIIAERLSVFRISKFFIFAVVVLLCLPSTLDIIHSYSTSVYFITKNHFEMYKFVGKEVPLRDGVMVLNVDKGRDEYNLPEAAAISGHPIFYESTITSFKNTDLLKEHRKTIVNDSEILVKNCVGDVGVELGNTMKKNNNKYILTLEKDSCLDSTENFELIKRIGDTYLYKLKS